MTRPTVHEYAAALRPRYRRARKGVRKRILDEFCQTTGMHRKAAIRLLGRGARPACPAGGLLRRGRPRRYGPEVTQALVELWKVGDRMCGKLLAAVIPHLLAALERHGELTVSPEVRELLLAISPSTIDRLLRRQRSPSLRQPQRRSPATTTLKSQIPIRTWSEWPAKGGLNRARCRPTSSSTAVRAWRISSSLHSVPWTWPRPGRSFSRSGAWASSGWAPPFTISA